MTKILLVEDQESARRGVALHLAKQGYAIAEAESAEAALRELAASEFDLLLLDIRLPGISGLELLSRIRQSGSEVSVLMMTAYATLESAVEAMKAGAEDYIIKPIQLDELTVRVQAALSRRNLVAENLRLRRELDGRYGFERLVGESRTMRTLRERLATLARDPHVSVLLCGETGTGKELVARAIHYHSPRSARPFVPVNCAALPDALLESELFGYEKGAFTGAGSAKRGLFESADGGTLFLDEISEMSPAMQAKLLRVIQDREFRRLGSTKETHVDIRIISASNKNLEVLVNSGGFREDLYYRLAVVPIYLLPLRQREEDISTLAQYFLERLAQQKGIELRFSTDALAALSAYPWPGNVRELENLMEMLAATRTSGLTTAADLPEKFHAAPQIHVAPDIHNLKEASHQYLRGFERDFIRRHLEANRWNITKTAEEIGLSRSALHEKIKEYGLASSHE